jgi:hypothetical protein
MKFASAWLLDDVFLLKPLSNSKLVMLFVELDLFPANLLKEGYPWVRKS